MSEGYASLDAHAYVDNSLNAPERSAFEAALRRDVKLRARVDAWEAQNEAIRLAFGASPRPRAPSLGRPSNENAATASPAITRIAELPARNRAPLREASAKISARWFAAAFGALAFVAGLVSFAGGPTDPRAAIAARAETALRASSAFADSKLDFISDDPHAMAAWLGGRFADIDPKRLAPPGWSLLGARISPGVDSAAALVLYEDALGGRAALLLEPTDALPDLPAAASGDADDAAVAGVEHGVLYAAVGPRRSGVGALIPAPPAR